MPLDAPDVSIANPDVHLVSFRYIDATGDVRSDAIKTTSAPTLANIQALAVALGAGSNASLYAVEWSQIWAVVADSSNATSQPKESVSQNMVYGAKNPAGDLLNLFVPAPVPATFIATTDEIDPAAAVVTNVLAAWVNLLPAGYAVVSSRFSGRREKNKQVKI